MLGTTYMHALGRDLDEIAGWTWQWLVRLGSEAPVSRSGAVSSALGGTPLTLERAERFVDVGEDAPGGPFRPMEMGGTDGRLLSLSDPEGDTVTFGHDAERFPDQHRSCHG